MSDSQTRPPTPARNRVSPLAALSDGNLYPYWDFNRSGLNPFFNAVKRAIASVNPFAYQQIPTSERMGLNIRNGGKFYKQEAYPSVTNFYDKYPTHYDPLSAPNFKSKPRARHIHLVPELGLKSTVPRFCERQIRTYKRCVLTNDNNEDVCKHEQQNIVAICPQWALHNLREKKLALLKDQALSNKTYREAMDVPYYNKGRTVADVPLRSWVDGTRERLRPDTLYADDRYHDITQEEVVAARERVKKRRQSNPEPRASFPTYDRTYEVPPRQIPLYSV